MKIIALIILFCIITGCNSQMGDLGPISGITNGPVITPISPQTTLPDTLLTVPFRISDRNSTLSCTNSISVSTDNSVLFPPGGYSLSGTAPNCMLSIMPGTGLMGSGQFSIKVTDGKNITTATFPVRVETQLPPSVLDFAVTPNLQEDIESFITLAYTDVNGDQATSCNLLSLSALATISTPCSCSLGICRVGLTSTPDSSGTGGQFIFTVTDNDGASNTATANFTIDSINDAPTISAIADSSAVSNSAISQTVLFTIDDIDSSITCTGNVLTTNSNVNLISSVSVANVGPGPGDCSLSLSFVANAIGTTTIDVTVTDGSLSATESFDFTLTGWGQVAYIKPSNPDQDDKFGESLSLDGDTLAVGAIWEDSNETTITSGTTSAGNDGNSNYGAVYVFRRNAGLWEQEAYIKPDYPTIDDNFGHVVSISRDLLAVGVPNEDSTQTTITPSGSSDDSSPNNYGAVYIYRRSGTVWSLESFIKAEYLNANSNFGHAISLNGNNLAVGVSGEDSLLTFIYSGAFAPDGLAPESGAVYIFRRNPTTQTWAREAFIKAANAGGADYFGLAVSFHNNQLAVAAPREDSNQTTISSTANSDNSATDTGAVYVYERNGTTWSLEAYIKAPNATNFDSFGSSVSISGNRLAVGSQYEDANQNTITTTATADNSLQDSGAVYIFKKSAGVWGLEAFIKSGSPTTYQYFGKNISLKADTLVVGVDEDDWNTGRIVNGTGPYPGSTVNNSGSAYVYNFDGTSWNQEAYLRAINYDQDDFFGYRVAMSGDLIAVSALKEDSNQAVINNSPYASYTNVSTTANYGAVYLFQNNARLFDVTEVWGTSSSTTMTINWLPTGGTATEYVFKYVAGASAPGACDPLLDYTLPGTTESLSALSPNTDYTFRICASDGTNVTSGKVFTVRTKSSGATETEVTPEEL